MPAPKIDWPVAKVPQAVPRESTSGEPAERATVPAAEVTPAERVRVPGPMAVIVVPLG